MILAEPLDNMLTADFAEPAELPSSWEQFWAWLTSWLPYFGREANASEIEMREMPV